MYIQKVKKAISSHMSLKVQILIVALWGAQLINTDAYYVNYAALLVITGICCYKNIKSDNLICSKNLGIYIDTILNIFAILFSIMIAAANYKICAFTDIPEDFGFRFKWLLKTLMIIIFLTGGYIAFWNIFHVIFFNINSLFWKKSTKKKIDSKKIFLISFVLLVLSRWIVLYYCQYPGELSPDSISQMTQLMSGTYSNHHPFYHTIVIKCFVDLGLNVFNDINAAVATYSFFQILFTAMCFSFAVSTMAKMKAPRWMIITTMLFFVMMPYHILYAITMWKDIMFGCFILLLVTFVYRCIKDIGNNIFNHIMLAISSMGTCLFRSNGFFAFVILTFTFILLWKMKSKRMLIIFASVIVLSFIMKHSVLAKLGVTQPDTIESLSIPAQQIARVVYEGCELNDWEKATLGEIIDIDQIAENYSAHISDPIKNLVRQKGNQNLIVDKKGDYIKLYFSLGLKYPMVYMRGWIDETRGYWNAGYEFWRYTYGVHDNSLGIKRTIRSISLDRKLREYLWLFNNIQALRLFLSIGLFIWMDILMLMIALLRKDKVGVFVSMPILVVVVSLLVATPIFSEFRYVYAAFCTLPMVMVIVLRSIEEEKLDTIKG